MHDSVTISGGDSDRHVRSSDFLLTLPLAGGAKKSYVGLTQAAPLYSKVDALTGNSVMAPSIDPAIDLGRIGDIIVPAHGNVTTTVTFAVADPIADKSAIRSIALK